MRGVEPLAPQPGLEPPHDVVHPADADAARAKQDAANARALIAAIPTSTGVRNTTMSGPAMATRSPASLRETHGTQPP